MRAFVPALAFVILLSPPGVSPLAAQDFLFSPPTGSLGLRGGWNMARADSDIFDDTFRLLTVDRGDFGAFVGGADLAVAVTDRVDAVLGISYSSTQARSQYRDYVEELPSGDTIPIRQSTRFEQVPVTAGVRFYLTPRGTSIGQFAWVPSRLAPFVGAAAGMTHNRFEQTGTFMDEETLGIRDDELRSNSWAPTLHAFAGMDIAVSRRGFLTLEARQAWASADLDETYFRGYEPIDLNGLQLTVGWSWRF